MTVWVVYEDRQDDFEGCTPPDTIFSTKEKAEEYVRRCTEAGMYFKPEQVVIEDHEVDSCVAEES